MWPVRLGGSGGGAGGRWRWCWGTRGPRLPWSGRVSRPRAGQLKARSWGPGTLCLSSGSGEGSVGSGFPTPIPTGGQANSNNNHYCYKLIVTTSYKLIVTIKKTARDFFLRSNPFLRTHAVSPKPRANRRRKQLGAQLTDEDTEAPGQNTAVPGHGALQRVETTGPRATLGLPGPMHSVPRTHRGTHTSEPCSATLS